MGERIIIIVFSSLMCAGRVTLPAARFRLVCNAVISPSPLFSAIFFFEEKAGNPRRSPPTPPPRLICALVWIWGRPIHLFKSRRLPQDPIKRCSSSPLFKRSNFPERFKARLGERKKKRKRNASSFTLATKALREPRFVVCFFPPLKRRDGLKSGKRKDFAWPEVDRDKWKEWIFFLSLLLYRGIGLQEVCWNPQCCVGGYNERHFALQGPCWIHVFSGTFYLRDPQQESSYNTAKKKKNPQLLGVRYYTKMLPHLVCWRHLHPFMEATCIYMKFPTFSKIISERINA